MCTQSLSCLKSKYLLFFSARQVSRHPGRNVIRLSPLREQLLASILQSPVQPTASQYKSPLQKEPTILFSPPPLFRPKECEPKGVMVIRHRQPTEIYGGMVSGCL